MAISTIGLSTHIWNNNVRSICLLAFYPLLLMAMVWAVSVIIGFSLSQYRPYDYGIYDTSLKNLDWDMGIACGNAAILNWWPTILTVVAIWFLGCYFFHTKMIRMLSHGRPVTREDEPALYNLLENLCISRGLPMPKLEIMETDARNAFASGINQKSYTITVTRGLLYYLQEDEVEAVLGHELTHIMNNDVRLLIISIIFTGMIGFTAQLLWHSIRYGSFTGRHRKSGRALILIMAIAVILWLGYMATLFTRFALSRSREYMADAGSIELTKNPDAMMRALLRIASRDRIPNITDDISLMCIENSKSFLGIFATHPPVEERIKTISETTGTPVPAIDSGREADVSRRFQTQQQNEETETAKMEKEPKKQIFGRNPWLKRKS